MLDRRHPFASLPWRHTKLCVHAEVRQSERRTCQGHSALAEEDSKGLIHDTAGV
jgi:hypothetical protein